MTKIRVILAGLLVAFLSACGFQTLPDGFCVSPDTNTCEEQHVPYDANDPDRDRYFQPEPR